MSKRNRPVRLYKEKEPVTVDIPVMILMCLIFALIFALIGIATRHYPSLAGVI